MSAGKAVIGQSVGPTAVINRSLVGFIKEALKQNFDEILGARHGLEGILSEDFVDLASLSESQLYGMGKTPAAALGSVRKKPTEKIIDCNKTIELPKRRVDDANISKTFFLNKINILQCF